MVHKFLSKYGLAVHLALLAALPLALTPFLSRPALATVVFWLCALAGVAFLVEPSRLAGEHLSQARARVRKACALDPLFWFLLIALAFAAVEWFNVGEGLRYDPEQAAWAVAAPALGGGPTSIAPAGRGLFATLLGAALVVLGIRHGLGLMARTLFGLVGAMVAGLGGFALAACACAGRAPFAGWMNAGFAQDPVWTSLFGVWLVIGLVSGVQAATRKWAAARVPFILGIGGNATALVFCAPPLAALAWGLLALVAFVFSLAALARLKAGGAVARTFAFAVFGCALAAFMVMTFMPEAARAAKVEALDPAVAFPETHRAEAETLARVSRDMWRSNPWFGVGADAFGLQVPFFAEKADWEVLPAKPAFAPNGYWTLLAEQGIVGCLVVALGLGLLLVSYGARLVGALGVIRAKDERDIFLFAVPPMAWCAPFVVALLAAETLFTPLFRTDHLFALALVALALASAAFPKAQKSTEK